MIVLRDTTGFTIKRTIDSLSHIRVGVLQIRFFSKDSDRTVRARKIGKPHNEFTLNEIQDLLEELEKIEKHC